MGLLPGVLAMFAGGAAISCQISVNAGLSGKAGKMMPGMVTYLVGGIISWVLVLLFGSGDLSCLGELEWWMLMGGVYGSAMVIMNTVAAPIIGVSLTVLLSMIGQLTMGVVIDTFGWFLVEPIAVSPLRVIGLIVTILGTCLIYRSNSKRAAAKAAVEGPANPESPKPQASRAKMVATVAMMIVCGALIGIQAPTNTQMAAHIGRMEGVAVNFTMGFIIMTILTLVENKGRIRIPQGPAPWQYCGGIFGVVMTGGTIFATPILGVGLALSVGLVGQMVLSLVIDGLGLFRSPRIAMDKLRLAGVVVVALGTALTMIARAML